MDMYQSRFRICPRLASNWTPNSWPALRAIRNLGPIGVPAYARMGSLECPSRSGISGARRGSRRAFEGLRSLEFPVADLVTLDHVCRHGYQVKRRAWCPRSRLLGKRCLMKKVNRGRARISRDVFQTKVCNEIVFSCVRMIFGDAAKARGQLVLHVKTRIG
jgi:hypothetical protein